MFLYCDIIKQRLFFLFLFTKDTFLQSNVRGIFVICKASRYALNAKMMVNFISNNDHLLIYFAKLYVLKFYRLRKAAELN